MTDINVCVIIEKSPDLVNRALINPENQTFWMTDLERFEPIKGNAGEVGSLARLHYVQKGRSYVMEDRLIECDPGKRYISEVSGDAIVARVEINLIPKDNSTELSLNWSGRAKNFILKLMLPFLRKKMGRQMKDELNVFKELVETRGEDFKKEKP